MLLVSLHSPAVDHSLLRHVVHLRWHHSLEWYVSIVEHASRLLHNLLLSHTLRLNKLWLVKIRDI